MKKPLAIAFVAVAALFGTTAANASHVDWSVGINLPAVATVVSSGPGYYAAPAPSYYAAPEVVYRAPPPVYYAPPAPRYYAPPVVVYERPYGFYRHGVWVREGYGGWGHDRFHHGEYRR